MVKVLDLAALRGQDPQVSIFDGAAHGAAVSLFVLALSRDKGPRRHRHAYEETFVILDGEIRLTAGDETCTVRGSSIVVIPAGTWHAFDVTSDVAHLVNVHPVPKMATEWADP